MSHRKRKPQPVGHNGRPAKACPSGESPVDSQPTASVNRATSADAPRRWLLAATVALFVARPLFPSEAIAQSGEGIPLVMLSLLLLVAWGITIVRRGRWTLRLGATDAAVFALLAIHSASALWAAHVGNARAAMNVLWAWAGLGVAFFLLRQLVRPGREARAMAAVMIALAVALSGYGLYQYAVQFPEMRREYQRDPEKMMWAGGIWFERGTIARAQFDQRLASREPLGTFSLTNSLAGYLAPWLVLAIGLASLEKRGRESLFAKTLAAPANSPQTKTPDPFLPKLGLAPAMILVVATVGPCLLLTKSRSALLATVVGLALVALLRFVTRRRIGWRLPVIGGAMAIVLVVGAVAVGGLDRQVLSEAGKSLGYRVQYWRSTMAMIADHPWLGCGPGQFQNVYPAYKLPEASEEVADPHNFLLEVWSTAGTPAAVAMLAVLACFAWSLRKCTTGPASASAHGDSAHAASPDNAPTADGTRWICAGALAGFLLAWPMGILGTTAPRVTMLLIGLPLAAVTLLLLACWVKTGRLSMALVAVAMVVILINLSAAGGIGFPGVAGTFWVLLALGLSATDDRARRPLPPAAAWGVAILAAGLAAACYWTAYEPVLSARAPMIEAMFDAEHRRAHLLVAAQADPLSPEAPRQLALLALANWRTGGDSPAAVHDPKWLDEFDQYAARAVQLDPQSNSLWATVGDARLEISQQTASKDQLALALAAYRRAIELYPNKAEYHAKLALALAQAGQAEAARDEARTAYRLDERMPHADKKLPANLRERLLRNGLGP